MKKLLKFVILPLIALVAIVIGLLLVPAVQKKIVTVAVGGTLEDFKIEHISAGFGSAQLQGVSFKKDGLVVSLKAAQTDYSLSDIIFKRHIALEKVTVQQAFVDLTAMQPSQEPATATQEATTSQGVALPELTFYIGELAADATVVLAQGRLDVMASAAQLGAGHTGTLAVAGTFEGRHEGTVLSTSVQVQSQLSFEAGALLPNAGTLSAHLAADAGEIKNAQLNLSATVATQPGNVRVFKVTLADAALPLLTLDGQFDEPNGELVSSIDLSVKDTQLTPFAMGMKLPSLQAEAKGQVRFTLKDARTALKLGGKATARDFSKIDAALSDLGELSTAFDSDVVLVGSALSANVLSVTLDGNGQRWLGVQALKPFAIDLNDEDSLKRLQGELLEINLTQFPLVLARNFIKPLEIKGGALSGKWTLSAQDGALKVESAQPLELAGLTLLQNNALLTEALSAQLNTNAQYRGGQLSFGYGLSAAGTSGELLRGTGTGQVGMQPLSASVKGDLQLGMPALSAQPVVAEKLPKGAIIPYIVTATYDVDYAQDALALKQLNAQVRSGQASVLALSLVQPLSINLTDPAKTALPDGELASLSINELSLLIAAAFLPEGMALNSGKLSADLRLKKQGSALALEAPQPVKLSQLDLSNNGAPWVKRLSLSLSPRVAHSGGKTEISLSSISVMGLQQQAANGSLRLVLKGLKIEPPKVEVGTLSLADASATLNVQLRELLDRLPVAPVKNMRRGQASVALFAKESGDFSLTAKLTNVQVDFGSEAGNYVSDLTTSLSGNFTLTPSVKIAGPFVMQSPTGISKLNFSGDWLNATDAQHFKVALTGDTLYADDLMVLAAAFNPPTQNPQLPQPSAARVPAKVDTTPDRAPFWKGFRGTAQAQLNKLVYGTFSIDKPAFAFSAADNALQISTLSAQLAGAPFAVKGSLSFDETQARLPYALSAQAGLQSLELGNFMKRSDGNPIIDGKFSMQGQLANRGANITHLLETLQGSLALESTQGTLYLLANQSSDAVQAISGLAGIANAFLGRSTGNVAGLSSLMNLLNAIHYDNFSAQVTRGGDLDIVLQKLVIKGNEAMISGTGRVSYLDDVALTSWPMRIDAQLFVRGGIVRDLMSVGILGQQTTADGYYPGPVFPISGTLTSIDSTVLWDVILENVSRFFKSGNSQTQQQSAPAQGTESGAAPALRNVLKGFLK